MAIFPTVDRYEVVPAQTLAAASAVVTSAPVRCLGALEVYFICFATTAGVATAAAVYEYSMDEGVTWRAAQTVFFDTNNDVAAAALNGGRLFFVRPNHDATNPGPQRMACTHVRLKVTGNAGASPANDIAGFRVDAVVVAAT